MREKERIGILGGTFNPIHTGHLKVAEEVQKRFRLNKILFIPSYIPPHKESTDIVSPPHRLRMVKLAISPYSQFASSSVEIEAKGRSYSIDTLKKMKENFPKAIIFFILGIDAFLEIDTWREYEKVLEQCYFIIVSRPGYRIEEASDTLPDEYMEGIVKIRDAEEIKEDLLLSYKIFLFPMESLDISSTEIRKKIREDRSIEGLVPKTVKEYIQKNKLYRVNNGKKRD